MILDLVMVAAMTTATTYGYGERYCGDEGKPVACDSRAITASGVRFDPKQPHVAVPAPKRLRLRKGIKICFLSQTGAKVYLPVTDKKKWHGQGGFDFSPGALRLLGVKPTRYWSGKVRLCNNMMGFSAL